MFLMVSLWENKHFGEAQFPKLSAVHRKSQRKRSPVQVKAILPWLQHALGMGVVATVCSRNTNVIMVWAWMQWQLYALGTRTLSWFGHGCSGNRRRLEQERYHGLGMGAVATVCSRNTNVIMVWAWMLWQPYALRTRTLSWFGHGRSGNRRRLEQERYHGLGMDALATVCSRNTNVIMVWAWMLWQPYALRTRTLSWFGHGRSGNRRRLEQERYHGLGMDALATVCSSCLLCRHPDKMPRSCRCFHIGSQVQVAASRSRCQPRAPHGVATLCKAVAEQLTFQNVRFIRGRSWRTYLKHARASGSHTEGSLLNYQQGQEDVLRQVLPEQPLSRPNE